MEACHLSYYYNLICCSPILDATLAVGSSSNTPGLLQHRMSPQTWCAYIKHTSHGTAVSEQIRSIQLQSMAIHMSQQMSMTLAPKKPFPERPLLLNCHMKAEHNINVTWKHEITWSLCIRLIHKTMGTVAGIQHCSRDANKALWCLATVSVLLWT